MCMEGLQNCLELLSARIFEVRRWNVEEGVANFSFSFALRKGTKAAFESRATLNEIIRGGRVIIRAGGVRARGRHGTNGAYDDRNRTTGISDVNHQTLTRTTKQHNNSIVVSSRFGQQRRSMKRVLVNPYAKKPKQTKEITTKPVDIFKGLQGKTDHEKKSTSAIEGVSAAPKPTAVSTTETSLSVSLPVWHRLPSKNLSFGSAEILTMPQACAIRVSGQSIRVTGVVLHRSTTAAGDAVNLVLGNPVAPIQRPSSILKHSVSIAKKPKTESVLFDKTKKRKIVFRKKTERRLSFASGLAKVDPVVQLKESLGEDRLWVSAPPDTVLHLQDTVTVIGEMELRDERPCLVARIVRKTNGMHAKLYHDALLARQARFQSQVSTKDNGLTQQNPEA